MKDQQPHHRHDDHSPLVEFSVICGIFFIIITLGSFSLALNELFRLQQSIKTQQRFSLERIIDMCRPQGGA